jgi:hypothetical protein
MSAFSEPVFPPISLDPGTPGGITKVGALLFNGLTPVESDSIVNSQNFHKPPMREKYDKAD